MEMRVTSLWIWINSFYCKLQNREIFAGIKTLRFWNTNSWGTHTGITLARICEPWERPKIEQIKAQDLQQVYECFWISDATTSKKTTIQNPLAQYVLKTHKLRQIFIYGWKMFAPRGTRDTYKGFHAIMTFSANKFWRVCFLPSSAFIYKPPSNESSGEIWRGWVSIQAQMTKKCSVTYFSLD